MRRSAGILMFRGGAAGLEVLLVHPGGPFWRNKDSQAWSIPKGEFGPDEPPLDAALREFEEELGCRPAGVAIPLGEVRQRGGKRVTAYALRGDFDPAGLNSTTVTIEWPPRSSKQVSFPEVDRAAWFGIAEARDKLVEAQTAFLDRLVDQGDGVV